jgi:small basic protein
MSAIPSNLTDTVVLALLAQTQTDLEFLRATIDHSWVMSRAFAVLAMVSGCSSDPKLPTAVTIHLCISVCSKLGKLIGRKRVLTTDVTI